MGEHIGWMIKTDMFSHPDFDHVICKMSLMGLGLESPYIGFISYNGMTDDVRIHLKTPDSLPLSALMQAIDAACGVLKEHRPLGDEESGYGRSHIEACCGEEIRAHGFKDADAFVSYILEHATERLFIPDSTVCYFVVLPEHGDMMVAKLNREDGYYDMLDAFFADRFYLAELHQKAGC